MSMAILRDERDLLWLALSEIRREQDDCVFDVHLLARDEPTEVPSPFLSGCGYREPLPGLAGLLSSLAEAVVGEVSALRHDPIGDGLSLELKARGEGSTLSFEVVLWLDLTRMNRARTARATRGRHQVGMRMFVTRAALEEFRSSLSILAFEGPSQYPDQ